MSNRGEVVAAVLVDGVSHDVLIVSGVIPEVVGNSALLQVTSSITLVGDGLIVQRSDSHFGDLGAVSEDEVSNRTAAEAARVANPLNALNSEVVGSDINETDDVAVIVSDDGPVAKHSVVQSELVGIVVGGGAEDVGSSNSIIAVGPAGQLAASNNSRSLDGLDNSLVQGSGLTVTIDVRNGHENVVMLDEAGSLNVLEAPSSRSLTLIVAVEDSQINGSSGGVAVAVSGGSSDLVDLGEIGVDLNETVTGSTHVIDFGQTALSANKGLGGERVDGGVTVGGHSNVSQILGIGVAVDVSALDVLGGGDAQILGDVALSNLGGVGDDGLVNDEGLLVTNVVGPLGSGTAEGISISLALELEVLVAESALVELQHLIGHITESGRVVDGGSISDGAEQEFSNQLTGSGSVEVDALDVLEHAGLLRGLRNMQRPISAGELTVLVVTDSTEDHGEDFVAGDLAGGLEGTVGIALDQLSVGAVADVALSPTGASHVAELVVGGVHGSLSILDVLSVHAINDRGHLSAGDIALGLEGTVLITLEHTHAIQNGNSLSVIIADALVILEGVGADGQRQSHDQSQHHCE